AVEFAERSGCPSASKLHRRTARGSVARPLLARQNRGVAVRGFHVADAALLFADIVDSTLTTQRLGDERAAALWTEHDRCARNLLRHHRGREMARADGFLLLFSTAADAARYALDYHAQIAELGLAARAGLH